MDAEKIKKVEDFLKTHESRYRGLLAVYNGCISAGNFGELELHISYLEDVVSWGRKILATVQAKIDGQDAGNA